VSDVSEPHGRANASAALELRDVCAAYGPFRALFDVSFSVPDRGVCALLGPNGAGKTTIARVASGLVVPTSGSVWLRGEDVTALPAWKLARRGVAHAVEGRSVFASLTVEDNLVLAFRRSLGSGGVADALDRAFTAFPRLGERRKQEAGTLSGGEQRMLSLARVLADPPMLLIADELSLGLAPVVVDEVYATLATIKEAGTSLLIVEQHVHRALALADVVVLLGKGRVRYAGPASDIGDLAGELLPG
jgi:branched-chain amino acid transport system ATP-binding protein